MITYQSSSMALGQAMELKFLVMRDDGSYEDQTQAAVWLSTNESVVKAGTAGHVQSKGVGSTVVSAVIGGYSASIPLRVTAAAPVSLAIVPSTASIALGGAQQLSAIESYTDGSTQDVTASAKWTASAPEVAAVNGSGIAAGKGIGSSVVTAQLDSEQATSSVTVTSAGLVSIAVSGSEAQLALGLTEQFRAVGTYTDGSTQDLTSAATWASSAPDVAPVNSAGLVSGKAVGTSVVTAQLNSVQASSPLTVTPAALVSIAVRTAKPQIALGLTEQLAAIGTFTDGSTQDVTTKATWKSSAPDVAPVSEGGLVSAKATGASVITAQVDAVQSSAPVAVTQAVLTALAVNTTKPQLALGLSQQLTAVGKYTDGSTRDVTSSALWKSSVPEVVSVESSGVVTAKAVGASVVTAHVESMESSAPLTVTAAALVSIAVKAPKAEIALGLSQQFTAIGTYTDNSTQDLTSTAAWKSSAPEIAPVSAGGLVSAKRVGAAMVFAQADGVQGSSLCTVGSAAPVSLVVSVSKSEIALGLSEQLAATATYTDGSTQDVTTTATWKSSAPEIAPVGGGGLVSAKAIGTSVITAAINSVQSSAPVAVIQAELVSLAVSMSKPHIVLGMTAQLTATGTYTDGSTRDLTVSVTWSAGGSEIVTLSSDGQAFGRMAGTAQISASQGGVTSSLDVQVSSAALVGISIAPSTLTVAVGQASQFRATGLYEDGTTQDISGSATWSVLDTDLASISLAGLLFPAQPGSTTVQAVMDSNIASATVEILPMALSGYFSVNPEAADSILRITNSGLDGQSICTMLYVFDQDQQMTECCGCAISHNGLRTLSTVKDLTNNPLIGIRSTMGSIMVVPSDQTFNSKCDPGVLMPEGMSTAWSTHLQPYSDSAYAVSETPLSVTPLNPTLAKALQAQCMFVQQLGSGQGICQCGSGD